MKKTRKVNFADCIWLNTHPEVTQIGGATTADTIARVAATKKITLNLRTGRFRVGDEIEWKAELKGRITIDQQMLDGAINESLN